MIPSTHPDKSSLEESTRHNPWEQRYRSGDMHWDKGAPAPGLVEFLGHHRELPRGSVAVPGCGLGHDVRAWAAHGFTAHGFDIAPSAIRMAAGHPGNGGHADYSLADFLTAAPPHSFDYVFEHTLFCAIQPGQRDAYVESLLRWIKPGGTYLAVHYILCEGAPPFPVSRAELWQRIQPHFHLKDVWIPRSYPNRVGRELMSWWRRK
jgi:2-polyprenyl-3-methyl-5-hydroxy-6-metoxy-1,4-benzoquinol methylase